MSDPVFLTIEQIKTLHRIPSIVTAKTAVRDVAALESAALDPCNVWLYGQGAYSILPLPDAFHVAQAQAFLDGNKRTGRAGGIRGLTTFGDKLSPSA